MNEQHYLPDDPLLHEIRELCSGFAGTTESTRYGVPVFEVGATPYAAWALTSDFAHSVAFVVAADQVQSFTADKRTITSAQLTDEAWVGVDLGHGDVAWNKVVEWLTDAYERTAGTVSLR